MTMRYERTGAVIIGRNEGARLVRCIESVVNRVGLVVYVDSGSTDDSVRVARSLSAHVVELDQDAPFTAARARNAGLQELQRLSSALAFVQFIDGDCELVDGWLAAAHDVMHANKHVAVVCGRRRERHPEQSAYNKLIGMEWDTPIGETDACGGDALMRIEALDAVGGFDDRLIAGEEPELCLRLRNDGWRIHRIDHDMTLHDANITRFVQWWRRSVRCGHAYAEGRAMHGAGVHRYRVREVRSVVEWALILPVAAIGFAPFTYGLSLLSLGGYGVLGWKVRRDWQRRGYDRQAVHRAAVFTVIGKFAELVGLATYWWNRLLRQPTRLIEYKGVEAAYGETPDAAVKSDASTMAMEAGRS